MRISTAPITYIVILSIQLLNGRKNNIQNIVYEAFADGYCICYLGNDIFIETMLSGIEIAFVSQHNTTACKASGYIIAHANKIEVIQLFELMHNFIPHRRIIIFCHYYNCEEIEELIHTCKLHALDVLLLQVVVNEISTWNLFQSNVINYKTIHKISTWKPYFGNNTVNMLIFDYEPFMFVREDHVFGFEKYILEELTNKWPVNYMVYPPFSWGTAMEAINNNLANISASGFWLMGLGDLDATYPTVEIKSTLLVPKPSTLPSYTFVFQSLRSTTWLMVIICIILATLSKYILSCLNPEETKHSLMIYFLDCYGLLTSNSIQIQQYYSKTLQCICLFWCMSCIILLTIYNAGFSTVNTVPRYLHAIKTYEDLVESGVRCYESTSIVSSSLIATGNALYGTIGQNMVHEYRGTLPTGACASADLIGNSYVTSSIEPSSENKKKLTIINNFYAHTYLTIILNHNSPYTEIFSEKIKMYWEFGFLNVWFERAKYDNYAAMRDMHSFFELGADVEKKPLSLKKMQGAFYVLMLGLIVAFVVFLIEILKVEKKSQAFEY